MVYEILDTVAGAKSEVVQKTVLRSCLFCVGEEWKEEDFVHHLSDAEWKEFEKEFADLIR